MQQRSTPRKEWSPDISVRFMSLVEDFYDLMDTHDSVIDHGDFIDDQEFGMELSSAVAQAEEEQEIAYNDIHSTTNQDPHT